jgi:peptide/nickel transport system substrate-binding protein
MKYTKNWHSLLILLITVSFFSCERKDSTLELRKPKGGVALGGSLSLAFSLTEIDINPIKMNNAAATFIGNQVHGTLVKNSPGFEEPTPCIAERWELDETGLIWLFHIRQGMTFQLQECVEEPREITASDVVNSLTRICSSDAVGGLFKSFRTQIKGGQEFFNQEAATVSGLEALDDYRLKITLNKPNQAFLYMLTEPASGIVHVCDDGNIAASGPFIIAHSNGGLSLERNEHYAINDHFGNQLPYLDRIEFNQFENTSAELEAFFAGEIDVVSNIYQDPIRNIMDKHIEDFASNKPKYVIQRSGELASYDLYTLHISGLNGYQMDYLGRPDLSRITLD